MSLTSDSTDAPLRHPARPGPARDPARHARDATTSNGPSSNPARPPSNGRLLLDDCLEAFREVHNDLVAHEPPADDPGRRSRSARSTSSPQATRAARHGRGDVRARRRAAAATGGAAVGGGRGRVRPSAIPLHAVVTPLLIQGDDPLHTRTILPVTPPFPSNSCACLASTSGNRCAMSGLIFCCLRRSSRAVKSCRNSAGFSRLSHWML